jgi:[ribosomal protein S5]-alanine N-acetyltransferase
VLESTGFLREGLARSYLKINGRLEDHLLFAAVAADRAPLYHARPA